MVQGEAHAEEWFVIFPDQEYIFGDFTERLWAYLTIQQLLNKQYVWTNQIFPIKSITNWIFPYDIVAKKFKRIIEE